MATTPEHNQPGSQVPSAISPEHEVGAPTPGAVAPGQVAPGTGAATPQTPMAPTVAQPAVSQPTVSQPTVPLQAYQQAPSAHAAESPVAPSYPAPSYGAAPTHATPSAFGISDTPAAQPEYPAQGESAEHSSKAQTKGRTGMLLAGLAIGAILGGVVGGGVAAVVAANSGTPSIAQGASGNTLTLSNTDSATEISGVAAVATPSVVTLEVTTNGAGGSGSGVIYSEDGYIVTNAHVVTLDGQAGDGASIRVKLSDGRILDGALVGVDPYADLAVVKIEADNLTPITIADSSNLNVGDTTVAIGAPLDLASTVTSGIVSAVSRGISVGSSLIPDDSLNQQEQTPDQGNGNGFPWDFRFGNPEDGDSSQSQTQTSSGGTVTLPVIQTDASINPGNSGGALLNANGELIGINVAIASTSGSSETAGSVGLGFAIPSNLMVRVADTLISGEQPSHGLLGASVANSSQDDDEDANRAGGLIVEVTPDSAAEKAGLRAGDVIVAVDGMPAVDGTSLSALIRQHEGGSTITLEYSRGGELNETEVTLGSLSA